MKKTLTVITLLAGAVSAYSQGQIIFNTYSGSLRIAIFNTQSVGTYAVSYGGYSTTEQAGNSTTAIDSLEKPAGTTPYTASTQLGAGYSAQLFAGPAGITTVGGTSSQNGASSVGLVAVGSAASFHTTATTLGMVASTTTIQLPTESYFSGGDQISVAVAAWANTGVDGAATSLAVAQADGYLWGISPVEQTTASGGLTVPSATGEALPTTLESFSLGTIPEPSTIALGVIGASTLLFRRRK